MITTYSTDYAIPVGARITVDPRNARIKLHGIDCDIADAVHGIELLARRQGLDKIWGFVSTAEWLALHPHGFACEGALPGYFPDGPGVAVARFLTDRRAKSLRQEEEDALITRLRAEGSRAAKTPEGYTVRAATEADCAVISRVMTNVFTSYPTPIDGAPAIAAMMAKDVHFILAEYDGEVVSVASADVDRAHAVAELTDCATLPEHRGKGLMTFLLAALAESEAVRGLRSLFTLARATSVGINTAFSRLGYTYNGRLVNNCHIAGDWEDMNLWVTRL